MPHGEAARQNVFQRRCIPLNGANFGDSPAGLTPFAWSCCSSARAIRHADISSSCCFNSACISPNSSFLCAPSWKTTRFEPTPPILAHQQMHKIVATHGWRRQSPTRKKSLGRLQQCTLHNDTRDSDGGSRFLHRKRHNTVQMKNGGGNTTSVLESQMNTRRVPPQSQCVRQVSACKRLEFTS